MGDRLPCDRRRPTAQGWAAGFRGRTLALSLAAAGTALAPDALAGQAANVSLTVTTSLPVSEAVPRDEPLILTFSRPLIRPAERVAVFIGSTDVTSLFTADASTMSYERGVILLPRGRHELVVYHVESATGGWTEVLRQPFQTLGPLGFQPGRTDPSLTAARGQRVADAFDPVSTAPPEVSESWDLQFRVSTEHTRQALKVATQVALVGASDREKALRYRTLGDEAPRIDLSSYALQFTNSPVSVAVGHVSIGTHRHLVNRFASRGATLSATPSRRLDLSVSAVGGSNEVGWGNPFGIAEAAHRLLSGSLGVEAFETPGALRLELTGLHGSVTPQTGVNRGAVSDAAESQGVAARFAVTALNRRVRVEGGFALSAFDNPDDPSLAQGNRLVEVERETSDARYVEGTIEAIRDWRIGGGRSARATLGFRHERVDPLYRSLGAHTQADRLQNQLDVRAEIAHVSIQGSLGDGRTNLADIPSILTTRTGRSQFGLSAPVARVIGITSTWLPTLQLRYDRTHQFGDGIPENAGFSASHVPDQVSLNQTAQADWQIRRVTVGYSWNRSHQDNRQPGRETADLTVTRNAATIRLSLLRTLNVSADIGLEKSRNHQRDETDETVRWGGQIQWQPADRSALNLRYSDTAAEDLAKTRRRAQNQIDAQWSSRLPYLGRLGGEYYLRLTRSSSGAFNAASAQNDDRRAWWIDSGLNFTFF